MLVEGNETDRRSITRAVEERISYVKVASVPYGVSTSDTMSGVLHYDVAIMDWDLAPQAAAGLMQILRIKRPTLFIICLLTNWNPAQANRVMEAGADLCVVKREGFANVLPMVIAQWARRTTAVQEKEGESGPPGRWADAIDSIGDTILFVDADRTVLHANQAATKELHRTEEELLGRSYAWLLYSQERPPESCPIQKVLKTEEPARGTVVHAESERSLRVSAWPVPSATGRLSGVVALLSEPEEVGEATSAALAQSEVMTAVLAEGLDYLECGVVALDADHHVVWANEPAAELLDGDPESMVGESYRDLAARHLCQSLAQPQGFLETIDSVFEEDATLEDYTVELTDGSAFSYHSTPARGDGDAVRRLEHFYPAQKHVVTAEEAAPAEEAAAQAAGEPAAAVHGLTALPAMLFRATKDGTIEWCSAGASDVVGYPARSVEGMRLADLAADGMTQRAESLIKECLAGTRRVTGELKLQSEEGRKFWAELIVLPADEGDGHVEGVLRDVTDRKMAEAIRAIITGETAL
jgi:PAS domain S-box-containing protein